MEDPESDANNDKVVTSTQVASNTSQAWLSNHSTVVDEKLPDGPPANLTFIHHVLLDCDVETVANQGHQFLIKFFFRTVRRP